ncbi:MAG: methyltransferase domain-containing protein [Acetobacteraceae bacterium]|nr:methyltransferase domain-containing protein [Acetobacteraceae bacterium]
MTDSAFREIARAIQGVSDLSLSDDKGYLLAARLAPIMRSRGLSTLAEVAQRLPTADGVGLLREIAEATTTNETSFFRDGGPFAMLASPILPALDAARAPGVPLRVWSAACSSGQEAYSVAITAAETRPGRPLEIVGTDLSPAMVDRARAGLYSEFEVQRGLTPAQRQRWLSQEADGWRVAAELRRRCRFEPANLLGDLRSLGTFDVIFLRNVLIYFDLPTRQRVIQACVARLAPDGYLCLGAAETLLGLHAPVAPAPGLRGFWRLA